MIFGKTTTYAALALGTCALGTTLGVGSTLVAQTDAPSQKPAPPATTTPAAPATYTDAQLVPYGQFDPAGPRPKVSAEPSLGVQALRRRSRLDSAALKRLRVRNPSLAERSATQIHPQDFNVNLAQILSPDPLFVADVQYQWDLAQLRKEVDEAVAKGTNLSTAPAARSSSPEDDLDAALDRIKTLETELADLKARIARAEGAPGAAIAAPPRAVSPEAPASGGMPYYEPELIPVVPSVPAPPASPADPDTRIIRPTLPSQEVTPPRRYALVEAPNMVVELPSGPLARREMSPLVEPAIPRTPTVRAEAADRPVQRTAPAAPTPPSPPAYPPASEPLALPGTTDRPAASTAEPRPAAPTEKAAPKADSSATLLPGTSKILIAPASHDSVTVFDPKTKSRATYRAPQGTTSLFPIYSAEVVGLSLKGPEVRQVAAFPNQGDHWVVQDLREPAAGPIEPTVMEAALTLRAGRFYYGFSAKANRWAVLELKPAPDGQYPAGVTLGQATIVTEGDTIHIFDFATGEWSTIPTDTATKPGQ